MIQGIVPRAVGFSTVGKGTVIEFFPRKNPEMMKNTCTATVGPGAMVVPKWKKAMIYANTSLNTSME